MLIKLHNSRLFDTSPAIRFGEQYQVPETLWTELWKRYKLLDYSIADLSDYFHLKSGKPIKRRYMKRWIFLNEIYILAKPARDMGANVINTELFGDLEDRVVEEITRHMKSGSTSNSRIMA
jgi:hypothetical protein